MKDLGTFDFDLNAARNRRFEGLVSNLDLSKTNASQGVEGSVPMKCHVPVDERKLTSIPKR